MRQHATPMIADKAFMSIQALHHDRGRGPHSCFARHHAVAAAPAGELLRSAAWYPRPFRLEADRVSRLEAPSSHAEMRNEVVFQNHLRVPHRSALFLLVGGGQ